MKIVIASDFAGFPLKEALKKHLVSEGHEVEDVGQTCENEKVVYVDAVRNLAKEIQEGNCERGIVCCGTGAGVSIAANKFKGIYCVACESLFTAPKTAVVNNANVLAMGSRICAPDNACEMTDAWLGESFLKGFSPERAEFVGGLFIKLQTMEKENFK